MDEVKKTQKAKKKSDSFLTAENIKAVADSIPFGVCVVELSPKPTCVYCNKEFLRLRALSEIDQEMFAEDVLRFASPEDSKKIRQLADQAVKTGELYEYIYQVVNGDGTMPWIHMKLRHFDCGERKYPLILVTINDYTKYKAAETELLIQKERYRILEKTSSELLIEYKPDEDKFFYSFTRPETGFVSGEIDNYIAERGYTRVVHPCSVQMIEDALIAASHEVRYGEFEYLTKLIMTSENDDYQWHRLVYRSIADDSGKVICILARAKNINQVIAERTMLKQMGEIDIFTGLLNRYTFVNEAEKLLKASNDMGCVFMLLDLDNFKVFNSTYGQIMGDRIIQITAVSLQRVFNVKDIICRFDGDTFAVLMTNVGESMAKAKVKQLFDEFKNEMKKSKFGLTMSCAVIMSDDCSIKPDVLFEKAENELVKIKQGGKGRVNFLKIINE